MDEHKGTYNAVILNEIVKVVIVARGEQRGEGDT